MNLEITNYSPEVLKTDLIKFLKSNPDFKDFDYEGSTINIIVDLLVRNTYYIAYAGNMIATESFLDSAQIRANVVSHAQKLSYRPKSKTASTMIVDVLVNSTVNTPSVPNIVIPKNTTFVKKVLDNSYRFITTEDYTAYRDTNGNYLGTDITLKQGTILTEKYTYKKLDIMVMNKDIDTSTLKVFVTDKNTNQRFEYIQPEHIIEVSRKDKNYYLHENTLGTYTIQFGKDILGQEPNEGDIITIEYVACESVTGNQIEDIICTSLINGTPDILTNVKVPSFGGSDLTDIEEIKFIAPKIYKSQRRAVTNDDYEALVLELFPFVKSVKVWSGADNVPPFYGTVFISCVAKEGYGIPDAVKDEIVTELGKYKVGVSRILMTDPLFTNIDINIVAYYNQTQTTQTWSQIQSSLNANVELYGKEHLNKFGGWFNYSNFVGEIVKGTVIESVDVSTRLSQTQIVTLNQNTSYDFEFGNAIKENTVELLSSNIFDASQTEATITDNDGNIFLNIKIDNTTTSKNIGTIDYDTGSIKIKTLILDGDDLTIGCNTEMNNVFSKNNNVISLHNVNITRGVNNG